MSRICWRQHATTGNQVIPGFDIHRDEQRNRTTPVRHFDAFAVGDQGQVPARMLAQLAHTNALQVLHSSTRSTGTLWLARIRVPLASRLTRCFVAAIDDLLELGPRDGHAIAGSVGRLSTIAWRAALLPPDAAAA